MLQRQNGTAQSLPVNRLGGGRGGPIFLAWILLHAHPASTRPPGRHPPPPAPTSDSGAEPALCPRHGWGGVGSESCMHAVGRARVSWPRKRWGWASGGSLPHPAHGVARSPTGGRGLQDHGRAQSPVAREASLGATLRDPPCMGRARDARTAVGAFLRFPSQWGLR